MTVFWKQKWRDKFKVTWLLFLYFCPKFQKVPVCQEMCTNFSRGMREDMEDEVQHVWNASTRHTFPVTRLPKYVRWCFSQNKRSRGLLTQGNLGKVSSFILFFLGFLGLCANSIPCTLALNYFIILFLLFFLFIMDARNPEIRIHVWKVRTFIPAVFPPKGQEIQTTDNEL